MSDHVSEVNDSTFEEDVLQSTKPVLVDFWAEWCGPCRALAPTLVSLAEKYGSSATVLKLNVDDNPGISSQYKIMSIPTLILFSGGKEEERLVGAASAEVISRMIDKCIAKDQAQPTPNQMSA
ncbi:MAG TPA: thioredoxin [Pyrinomonadaceae bacterium]|jgi:thioredoxin 1|nr:thioredoxin [Pyrinomonadaceae bacterium]